MEKKCMITGATFAGILMIIALSGNSIWAINARSCLFVLGGTLISTLLAFNIRTFRELLHTITGLFGNHLDISATITQIVGLARVRRSQGPRELNEAGNTATNPFLRKGIELVVDGYNRSEITFIMEKEYELYFSQKSSQVNIVNTMAKFSPAFGFLGTIIGLIGIMGNVSDPANISKGMSLALLSTLYSLLFTNFIFLPLARKLSEQLKSEATLLNIILEGLLGIADSKNPLAISHRLESYMETKRMARSHLYAAAQKETSICVQNESIEENGIRVS